MTTRIAGAGMMAAARWRQEVAGRQEGGGTPPASTPPAPSQVRLDTYQIFRPPPER